MKQTAIQQAISIVRSRIDSIDETIMGKHTIHHLQQVERVLYDLLEAERQQIVEAVSYCLDGAMTEEEAYKEGEQYFEETYK
jgi:hypothetical protein